MIPENREGKIQWIQRNLLPLLETQLEGPPENEPDEERVNKSKKILAEEYLDEGSGILNTFFKVALPLVVIDSITRMPSSIYGLVFSIMGTLIMLVEADILGSESIAIRSEKSAGASYGGGLYLDEARARRLAHNTVMANIGLVWLFIGFLMQIIAIWGFESETLIQPLIHLSNLL